MILLVWDTRQLPPIYFYRVCILYDTYIDTSYYPFVAFYMYVIFWGVCIIVVIIIIAVAVVAAFAVCCGAASRRCQELGRLWAVGLHGDGRGVDGGMRNKYI